MTSDVRRWMPLLLCLLALPTGAWADWNTLNMTKGVTENQSARLWPAYAYFLCLLCDRCAGVWGSCSIPCGGIENPRAPSPRISTESTSVEIVWTVVPLIILIAMAIPAARVLIKMEDFSNSEMSIKITGYQWRWHYDYLDEGVEFYSQLDAEHNLARQQGSDIDLATIDNYLKEVDNPLVVPVGKKIRFLHTATDVIHSWWVPDLAVKKDAIPGFINENLGADRRAGYLPRQMCRTLRSRTTVLCLSW